MRIFNLIGNALFAAGFVVGIYLILNLLNQQLVAIFAMNRTPIATQWLNVDCPKAAGFGDEIELVITVMNTLDRRQNYAMSASDGVGRRVNSFVLSVEGYETETMTLHDHVVTVSNWTVYARAHTYGTDEADFHIWESSFAGACATWIVEFAGLRGMPLVIAAVIFSAVTMATGFVIRLCAGCLRLSLLHASLMIAILAPIILLLMI